jgi:hypothetical protein
MPIAKRKAACLAALTLGLLPMASHALDGITDRPGDFLASFAGMASPELDVISASVFYDASSDVFTLISTMAGPILPGSTAQYVWGVNRGAGAAGFAAQGLAGVRFDRTLLLRPDGTGTVGGGAGALPAGSVTISGSTITALVSGSLLPGTGFANKLDYTWNLWPRTSTVAGFAGISDFAPDNSNFTTTVPEPSVAAMLLGGLALVGAMARRRRAG